MMAVARCFLGSPCPTFYERWSAPLPRIGLMMADNLRRRPSIKTTLVERRDLLGPTSGLGIVI